MSAELLQFLTTNATLVILVVAVLAGIAIVQWRQARVAELELEWKAQLIEQGTSIADIEKLLAVKTPPRKGLLEQFAALSGGAKAGLIVGFVLVANMVMLAVIAPTGFGTHRGVPVYVPQPPAPRASEGRTDFQSVPKAGRLDNPSSHEEGP